MSFGEVSIYKTFAEIFITFLHKFEVNFIKIKLKLPLRKYNTYVAMITILENIWV